LDKETKKIVTALIQKVRESEDVGEKREVLIELGYKRDREVYPVLVEQLSNRAVSIQHAAVISLGRYGDPRAIEELIKPKILHSRTVNIRWAAVKAIGKLGDYRVIEHLLKEVDDHEWIVRNQAVTELKEKIREIIEFKESRYARILVRLFAVENEEIVDLAIEGFVELGEEGVDLLLDAIKSPSLLIRENAVRALGQKKTRRGVGILIDLLRDPEWRVRRNAAVALGEIGDRRTVEPLVQSLRDNVEKVQQQAMCSLVTFGKLCTIPLLNAFAREKNKFVLRAIILTLGEISDIKSVPAIIRHIRSSYFVVRRTAIKALVKFGPQIIDLLVPTLSFNQSNIKPLLKDASDNANPLLQLRAIKALVGLEDHRAVELLKKLVEDNSPEVQEAAMEALIQIGCAAWGRCGALVVLSGIGDKSLIPHFIHSLGDDSDSVRLEAVRALARVDGSDAIDPLVKVANKDRDPYIRYEAVRLLRRIGVGYPQVLELGLSALKDPSRNVRSQTARLLGNFQDDRSIYPLLKATADVHWSVRESAENALTNFGKSAVPSLIEALTSRFLTTRFRAARLLGEIEDQRAVVPLEKLLGKKRELKEVKKVVKEALDKLQKREAA